eukprot:8437584-Heterocapsa_arctica.AAC.1
MGQEAELRLPTGQQLALAFFRERNQHPTALAAAEAMQGHYGLLTLEDMCSRLAEALDTYGQDPEHPGTEMERYRARGSARELRAKPPPGSTGQLGRAGPSWGDPGPRVTTSAPDPGQEVSTPGHWVSDQNYPCGERALLPEGPGVPRT